MRGGKVKLNTCAADFVELMPNVTGNPLHKKKNERFDCQFLLNVFVFIQESFSSVCLFVSNNNIVFCLLSSESEM